MINKDINFLPERVTGARERRRKSVLRGLTGLLFFAALGWAILLPSRVACDYKNELVSVNREISKLEPARPVYEKKQKLLKDLKRKESAVKDIEARQLKVIDILRQINSILPRDCYVTYLAVKDKKDFIIEVVTGNPVETARVLVGLRKLGLFEKVELAGVGDVPLGEEPRPVKFELKFAGAGDEKEDEQQENINPEEKVDEQRMRVRDLEKLREELK